MPQKLRIAYSTCFLDVSGVTKINYDILLRLKIQGHDVFVIATERVDNWDFMFEININPPLHLHLIKSSKRFEYFIKYIQENKINVIFNTHSYWVYENLSQIKKRLPSIKVVDSLHVLEPYCFRGGYPDISANHHVHTIIDRSILISDNLKNYLMNNYKVDLNKLSVIRNGIDTEKFREERKTVNNFKNELRLDNNKRLIGFIGRLSEQKRPLMFLEIAKRVARHDNTSFFYMIGSGELDNKVRRFIEKNKLYDRVFLYNQRSDIEYVLNSTDLLLVPSSYEGAPLIILEAISTGTPVIASKVGAIEEYVGGICELIEVCDEETEINAFMEKALNETNEINSLKAHAKFIKENYNINKTAEKYRDEFLEVINQ